MLPKALTSESRQGCIRAELLHLMSFHFSLGSPPTGEPTRLA